MNGTTIDPGRLKHLEMIQAVIARMASNSFLIKGWSLTLLAAILALAAKDKIYPMAWVGFVPVVLFWTLDGFFLRQERLFRKLWEAKRQEQQATPTDFGMDTTPYARQVSSLPGTMFSTTLLIFHGALLVVLVVIVVLVRCKVI